MQMHKDVTAERIARVLEDFTGEIYQLPPVKASVKRAVRKRTVYYNRLLEVDERKALFKVACQSGTYVRKICYDIGEVLGTGAHMRELRRIRAGPFHVDENLVTLGDLRYAFEKYKETKDESLMRKVVLPIEYTFRYIPRIFVRDSAVDAICHGASLAVPGVVRLDSDIKPKMPVALFTLKGEVIALATSLLSTEDVIESDKGLVAKVHRIIMPTGVYPKGWKSRRRPQGE